MVVGLWRVNRKMLLVIKIKGHVSKNQNLKQPSGFVLITVLVQMLWQRQGLVNIPRSCQATSSEHETRKIQSYIEANEL